MNGRIRVVKRADDVFLITNSRVYKKVPAKTDGAFYFLFFGWAIRY